jgi:hypothetical protein
VVILNQWLEFQNGSIKAVKVDAVISKEVTSAGMEYIHVSIDGEEVYSFWKNPSGVKKKSAPKSMGGKKPYIMLMLQEVEKLRSQGIDNIEELIGFLVCLGNNVEWGTGRLIHKRSKKQLMYADLQKMFNFGKRKLDRVIKDLRQHELLIGNDEGYFISDLLIKKGSKVDKG